MVVVNEHARPPRWDERAQPDKSPLMDAFSLSSHLGIGCATLGTHYVSIWSIYIYVSLSVQKQLFMQAKMRMVLMCHAGALREAHAILR